MTFPSQEKYEGQWERGKLNGAAVYTNTQGDTFEGEFRDNFKNGNGIYKWHDGEIMEGGLHR